MGPILFGIVSGFTLALSIGPGFLGLFQTSISKGFKTAVFFAIGMLLSDIIIVTFCYLGFSELFTQIDIRITGILSAIVLTITGLTIFTRKLNNYKVSLPNNNKSFFQGFLINFSNPFIFIFWNTLIGIASKSWNKNSTDFYLFFVFLFLTTFLLDIIKCYLTEQINKILTSKFLKWLNYTIGTAFIVCGIVILGKSLSLV